jgi:hypothetical protein
MMATYVCVSQAQYGVTTEVSTGQRRGSLVAPSLPSRTDKDEESSQIPGTMVV